MQLNIRNGVLLGFTEPPENGTLIVPSGVREIGESAFKGCNALVRAVLPASLIKIGEKAFLHCTQLREVEMKKSILPPGRLSIGRSAFSGCSLLETVTIPPTLAEIGDGAFFGCDRLKRLAPSGQQENGVYLPRGFRKLGDAAFGECSSLPSLHFASPPKYFAPTAMKNCRLLKAVTIHDRKTYTFPLPAEDAADALGILFDEKYFETAFTSLPAMYLLCRMITEGYHADAAAVFLEKHLRGVLFPKSIWLTEFSEAVPGMLFRSGLLADILTHRRLSHLLSDTEKKEMLHNILTDVDCLNTMNASDKAAALFRDERLSGIFTAEDLDGFIAAANEQHAYETQLTLTEIKRKVYGITEASDIPSQFQL